ncbi:GNAT family N-acetyltransferase [Methylobacterium sp. 391_Methyba4]|uniref:GNAT family N-acetyltransferase n=1 Tax=Methylobacterium sp. 391_Methyba4 TaxID=3038924 RepID=UPI00241D8270|nr:GNAT family N-acetyltransferase [Methylobacterium sp. 391_Methyba4]WFS06474.1 GNAT family N-acetyltransferase [Methylobacterium sp. 391_Methyba4]
MHTFFLGEAEVGAYAADLAARLVQIYKEDPASVPKVWVSLGVSGDKLTDVLLDKVTGTEVSPDLIYRAAFDRGSNEAVGRDGDELPRDLKDATVLVIDAAIHSGMSMRHLVDALSARSCDTILSYSLVVKVTSEFVPSLFGLMIGEHDRAFFQLDRIPNNRLLKKPPFGSVRLLRQEDIERSPDHVSCGVPSIDRMTFGDLWYYTKTQRSFVYLYEIGGKVVGFIHFKRLDGQRLFVDLVASHTAVQGQGVGGVLMRWAETYARAARMAAIELWAIDGRVGQYERFGYGKTGESMHLGGEGELYHHMRRKLLYNLKPDGMDEKAA